MDVARLAGFIQCLPFPITVARNARTPALVLLPLAAAVLLFLGGGCATYTEKTSSRDAAWRTGNLAAAVSTAKADAEANRDNKDTLLYQLEQGAILRAAALDISTPGAGGTSSVPPPPSARDYLVQSNAALDAAEQRVNAYEAAARIKVGSEVGALLTNQANTPYRGRSYDKVMLNTYKALNHLQLGNRDNARVELNRALQRQRDAVDENARRIEEAQASALAARQGRATDENGRTGAAYDVDRATSDPRTAANLSRIESSADTVLQLQPYADYVNPFSVLLDGLYFLNLGADSSDAERARKSLERAASMAPLNPYLKQDLDDATAGRRPHGVTYILYETGSAPSRDQVRIDIPIFIVTSSISYVGAAFPTLRYNPAFTPAISIAYGDGRAPAQTALVCNMDAVVARDFKNDWPTIVTKTLVATATRATLDAVVQKQARDNFGDTGQIVTQLFSFITQAAINIADTRTWRTLPKEFHYARIPTPTDRVLGITVGNRLNRVPLSPGDVNIVYVKSIAPGTAPLISEFPLKN